MRPLRDWRKTGHFTLLNLNWQGQSTINIIKSGLNPDVAYGVDPYKSPAQPYFGE
jgi:hypothetical protein